MKCIIENATGIITRVTDDIARLKIAEGTHKNTTKAKYRAYQNSLIPKIETKESTDKNPGNHRMRRAIGKMKKPKKISRPADVKEIDEKFADQVLEEGLVN
jgi:hypothetical protein